LLALGFSTFAREDGVYRQQEGRPENISGPCRACSNIFLATSQNSLIATLFGLLVRQGYAADFVNALGDSLNRGRAGDAHSCATLSGNVPRADMGLCLTIGEHQPTKEASVLVSVSQMMKTLTGFMSGFWMSLSLLPTHALRGPISYTTILTSLVSDLSGSRSR
jgi:hypothetical protein